MGEGVFQTGLAQRAGALLVTRTGNSEFRLTVFMMLLVAFLSAFISNTGTVAILLPVVVSLCQQMQIHPGRLLMPLAFASSMGGALTLIGTAPNMIARQSLIDYGYEGISFFAFTPIGLVFIIVGIVFLWFYGRKRLDKPQDLNSKQQEAFNYNDLLQQYDSKKHIQAVRVLHSNQLATSSSARIIGKQIDQLGWPSSYEITVLEVIKPTKRERITVKPSYQIDAEDVLIVLAEPENVLKLIDQEIGLTLLARQELANYDLEECLIEGTNLAEVILTPQSRLTNKTLQEVSFREKYKLTVLALKSQYKSAIKPSSKQKISYGDSLLVHGRWDDIDILEREKRDLVVLRNASKPAKEYGELDKAIIAAAIIVGMLLIMVVELMPVVITVIIAAILTAQQMGVSPLPMVMAVAYSASMAFATPVATPPNAMVMAAGKYTFMDFLRVGMPLQVVIAIFAVILVPIFFPF